MSSQVVESQVKELDGFDGIEKGFGNTVVVRIEPTDEIWSSAEYRKKISEAFEVELWKVWLHYVINIYGEITLAFKVKDTILIGEEKV
jgi:hypothetical protein